MNSMFVPKHVAATFTLAHHSYKASKAFPHLELAKDIGIARFNSLVQNYNLYEPLNEDYIAEAQARLKIIKSHTMKEWENDEDTTPHDY